MNVPQMPRTCRCIGRFYGARMALLVSRPPGACGSARSAGEALSGGGDRHCDVVVAVCGADEAGLVERRCQIDAALEHRVEEAVEALLVGRHHLCVVLR